MPATCVCGLPGVLTTAGGSLLCVGGEAVLELTVLVDGALARTEVACVDVGVTVTGVVRVVFVALDGVSM